MTRGGADVISAHIIQHVIKFRRQWGAEPTAKLAVGFTRQQQAPRPEYPASDQYAAYCAMAYLRSIGRES